VGSWGGPENSSTLCPRPIAVSQRGVEGGGGGKDQKHPSCSEGTENCDRQCDCHDALLQVSSQGLNSLIPPNSALRLCFSNQQNRLFNMVRCHSRI
jgi:hypothetical protein